MVTRKQDSRRKTDIPVPEPRHRVAPAGVSSGISFRELPPPSLDEIRKVCEHYQQKCAGTYKSLASRYVYQMATEIEHLVDAIKDGGYLSEAGSLSTLDDRDTLRSSLPSEQRVIRCKKKHSKTSRSRREGGDRRSNYSAVSGERRNARALSDNQRYGRPHTACASRKPGHDSRRIMMEYPLDYDDNFSLDTTPTKPMHYRTSIIDSPPLCNSRNRHRHQRGANSLDQLNLEDQNEEVLRWLKEEMQRSQLLIKRSKHMHDADLFSAQKEIEKVKKAAKHLIKAVHKKGKDKAAKSEANAEAERRRRVKSQKTIESLIHSHSEQIDLLKKGLHRGSATREALDDLSLKRNHRKVYPWGELEDDKTDVSFSVSDASDDLTSILDDLAEEAYQQSCC